MDLQSDSDGLLADDERKATLSNLNLFWTFLILLFLLYWVKIWCRTLLLLNVWDSPLETVDFCASHADLISSMQWAFFSTIVHPYQTASHS